MGILKTLFGKGIIIKKKKKKKKKGGKAPPKGVWPPFRGVWGEFSPLVLVEQLGEIKVKSKVSLRQFSSILRPAELVRSMVMNRFNEGYDIPTDSLDPLLFLTQ